MSASAHYDAVFARLNADTVLAGKGADTVKRSSGGEPVRTNYWILYRASAVELDDGRLTKPQSADSRAVYRFDFRAVGTTGAAVDLFMDKALVQLVGWVPEVVGRLCTRVRLVREVDGGVTRFDDVTSLYYHDRSFEFSSQPV